MMSELFENFRDFNPDSSKWCCCRVLPKPRATVQVGLYYYGLGDCSQVAVFVSEKPSPAHLNPAVTVGVALCRFALGFRFALYLSPVRRLCWVRFWFGCTKPYYRGRRKCRHILATFSTGSFILDIAIKLD